MKRWVLNLLSVLIGFTSALFLLQNQTLQSLFSQIGKLFLSITPFITYGMLVFLISAGAASLNLQRLTKKALLHALLWVALMLLAAVVTGGFLGSLIPSVPFRDFSAVNPSVSSMNSSLQLILKSIDSLLSGQDIHLLYRSYGLLFPVIVISIILGYGITPVREVLRPAYSVINSFSEVSHTLLGGFSHVLNIGLAFLSGLFFAHLLQLSKLQLLLPFFIYLGITVFVFIFLVIPLAAASLTKERHPYRLLFGLASPVLLSLFSGSSSFALPITLQHTRNNLGTAKRVNSTALPLISLLGRSGSLLMSIFTLTAFYAAVIGTVPSLFTILKIAAVSSVFSLGAYAVPGFEVLMITYGTAAVLNLTAASEIHMSVLFILYPLLQGLAAVIDTLSAGIGSASCGYKLQAHINVTGKERI